MTPKLKLPGTTRLKLSHDVPLSNFAFKFNLHRYSAAPERGGGAGDTAAAGPKLASLALAKKSPETTLGAVGKATDGGGGGGGGGGADGKAAGKNNNKSTEIIPKKRLVVRILYYMRACLGLAAGAYTR